MQIVTTHKNTDFDGFASVVAATLLYPDAIPVLPKQLNPNVKAFLSLHKERVSIIITGEGVYEQGGANSKSGNGPHACGPTHGKS